MARTTGNGEWHFRLSLIRHGETNQNRDKIIQGQGNTALNEKGTEQVELLGNRFKYERLTRIYSSDLQRALKTAEGVCRKNLYLKDKKICVDTLLRERNFGEAEGKLRLELKKILRAGKIPHGAETEAQVQKRAVDFFATLLRDVSQLRKSREATKVEKNELTSHENERPQENNNSDPIAMKTNHNASLIDHRNRSDSGPLSNTKRSSLTPVLLKDLCYDAADTDNSSWPIHVMVVSHGGILRHFVSYFAKNFQSRFPVDNRKLLKQICPNTGVTEFTITLVEQKVTHIECWQLYDKAHLN